MNVYDFDETIYRHDSTADFVLYLFTHRPKTLLNIPRMALYGILYGLHIVKKQTFKDNMYRMLRYVDDLEDVSWEFVRSHMHLIKPFYLKQQKEDDIVISASPAFNIEKFCKQLGIRHVMASNVDTATGKTIGLNCHGEEKVRRFREVFGDAKIDELYSDSLHDTPLAKQAEKAFLVKKDKIMPWPFES